MEPAPARAALQPSAPPPPRVRQDSIVSAAELYPGDSFGEASFLDLKKRTVSVCALEPSVALRVQRDDYLLSLRAWHTAQLHKKLALLQSVPLLSNESRRVLRPWAERLVEESAVKGEVVVAQGQEAKRMYFVVAGSLVGRITLLSADVDYI